MVRTEGANHFLNDGPAEILLSAIESCIPSRASRWTFRWPKMPALLGVRLGKPATA